MGRTIKKPKPIRQSGIELLRIIMMLQVIFLHIRSYGGYEEILKGFSGVNLAIGYTLTFTTRCPIYVYIIIFGYFTVKSRTGKSINDVFSKALKVYLPMLFYSVSIPLVLYLLGKVEIVKQDIFKALMPVMSRTWYFMTLYLIVLLLSPLLNRLIVNISKKEFIYLLSVLFFIFCVWDILSEIKPINQVVSVAKVVSTEGGKGLYGFLFMYLIGAYLRLHVKSFNKPKIRYLIIFALTGLANAALYHYMPQYGSTAFSNSNPFAVTQAVCLVLFFRDIKFKSRVVNYIASVNLGVYMIHEHHMVRKLLWAKSPTHNLAFYNEYSYLLGMAVICIVIFIGCGVIERLRVLLFRLIKLPFSKLKAHNKVKN